MIAQKVQSGTATPTFYECLYNDSSISKDQLYLQTNYSCYGYSNWRGPVKVPFVLQNAHKAAEYLTLTTPKSSTKSKFIELPEKIKTSHYFI